MALGQFSVLLVLFLVTTSSGWRRRRRGWAGCSLLPDPKFGKVALSGRGHGSTATYTCQSNYKIGTGDKTRKCNDGTWTGSEPSCVLGCVTLRDPLNGVVEVTGTSASYSCAVGRKLVGDRIRNCVGESWSGTEPQCEKSCLTRLTSPRYGSVTVVDNEATYSCSTNYKIVGAAVRLCNKNNGVWMGISPSCDLECGNLDNPANGQVTITGSTAHYRCNSGHRLKGIAVRLCKDKKWTESSPVCSKVCPTNLDSPVHGSVSVSDDKATYSCFVNYKIGGAAVRHCSNGEWLGETPTCVLECRRLENPANGILKITGNTAHYECNSNYSLKGDVVRTCQDRAWTGSAPICTKRCEKLSPPNNGYVSFVGQIATFACHDHFKLIGNKVTSCVNGQWSNSSPSCIFECSLPFKPLNGGVVLMGAIAYFQCHTGYNLVGHHARECKENEWTGNQPSCQKDCPSLSHPDHGFVTVSKKIANFTCFPNYILRGSKQMTCNSQGQWIGVQPICILSCPYYPLANGKFFIHDTIMVYQCNQGFTLVGDALRMCTGGKWTGKRPTCFRSDIIEYSKD